MTQRCTLCGTETGDAARVCPGCGGPLEPAATSASPPPPPPVDEPPTRPGILLPDTPPPADLDDTKPGIPAAALGVEEAGRKSPPTPLLEKGGGRTPPDLGARASGPLPPPAEAGETPAHPGRSPSVGPAASLSGPPLSERGARGDFPEDVHSLFPPAEEQRLAEYVRDGYEIFLVAGIAESGKTQLLDAYRQDGYLASVQKRAGHVLPTAPERLNAHPVAVGRRKVLFVDVFGEHFRNVYPHLAQTGEIHPSQVEFLRLVARGLAGVVLLVDLARLWGEGEARPEDRAQVAILAWTLELLRWLRFGGTPPPEGSRVAFHVHVDAQVKRMRRRLDVPVLVLFSKADELTGLELPTAPDGWLRRDADAAPRKLFPAGETPLLLTYHRLPDLFDAVATHADHFRFDFVHSIVTDPDSGVVTDAEPCGVELSLRWLLDPWWRRRVLGRRLPAVPSRRWAAIQRGVDRLTGRGARWRRLPEPAEP